MVRFMALLVATVAIAASPGTGGATAMATPKAKLHAAHGSSGSKTGAHKKCKAKSCPKPFQKGIQP